VTVYLVGAGPGDPDLLTMRAADLLGRADVVIYDRLSVSAALEMVPERAERINVGKTPGGPSTSQAEINDLLIAHGRSSETVVRLKGGDPFVFARGGEEAQALADAGIEFVVVPGISSAIAVPAYAGIPVTQRHSSTSLTIVTGHEDPARSHQSVDWQAIAAVGGTIVILMGVGRIMEITEALLAGGLAPETPAAAVRWGTRPEQVTTRATLATIADENLMAPSTIVVGEVAALELDWFETLPLHGRSIIVTRASHQQAALGDPLRRRGAHVIAQPAIGIGPPEDGGAALDTALANLSRFDWLVVTSTNGVDAISGQVRDARQLAGAKIAAVGSATASRLAQIGIVADLVADVHSADGLADVFPAGPNKVLLIRAAAGRDTLVERLGAAGADVEAVAGYQTLKQPEMIDSSLFETADAITFTSPSTVDATIEAVGVDGLPPVIASIGPVTTAALGSHGIEPLTEADPHTIEGLVIALERSLEEQQD
jgi:uroporphyrinogen III methyltransferase/synthase